MSVYRIPPARRVSAVATRQCGRCGQPMPHADWVMWECCSTCAHPGAVATCRTGVLEHVDATSRSLIAWQASVDEVTA